MSILKGLESILEENLVPLTCQDIREAPPSQDHGGDP